MKRILIGIVLGVPILYFAFAPCVFALEEVEYKKFKFEDASCDVGIRYRNTNNGMAVGVSAIATGKGAEFRKWSVSEIKLSMGGERFRPDTESKFYVTEESFFRVPGAIVIAAIGMLNDYGGSDFENGISKIGVGLGLGLIVLQAKGEITGERCVFNIPAKKVDDIKEGEDSIDILIENEGLHLKESIRIGLIRPTADAALRFGFEKMGQAALLKKVDTLKVEIDSLEKEQADYKYGQDPKYDEIQRRIENLETERGMAYKTWLERRQK